MERWGVTVSAILLILDFPQVGTVRNVGHCAFRLDDRES